MLPPPTPIDIRRLQARALEIRWSDGSVHELPASTLRLQCPCAACRETRGDASHSQPLTPKRSLLKVIQHSKDEELKLESIWAVGNYAIGLRWGDGHDTGIYTWDYLRELAQISTGP